MPGQDRILVRDLLLRGIVGVNDWEREKRQDILVNLELFVDTREAAATEAVGSTLNYRTVTKAVIAHVESSSHQLLEALAAAVARICVVEQGAARVRVRVEKPGALRFARSVGVEIERTAADFADEPGD